MIRWQVVVLILVIAALTLLGGTAFAAPTRIGSISEQVKEPVRVALDAQGNVYMTEASSDTLMLYNSHGKLIKSVHVPRPLGVTVSPSGEVYVGSDTNKSIEVYSADLSTSRRLTTSEISRPGSIAIDKDSRIYVTDSLNDKIRVYDAAGGLVLNIGTSGSGNGQFVRPKGVAVNDTTGEIYVSDRPIIQLRGSGAASGARIQVFNKSGSFLRSYGQYGINVGQICSPGEIAIHKTGLLYVADSCQGAVHILDPTTGASQGALYDMVRPLVNPLGVAVGKNGVVYVTSYGTNSVDIYGLDGYTTMDLNSAALTFSVRQPNSSAPGQTVSIANSGSGTLGWTATSDNAWLTIIDPATGLPASQNQLKGTTGPASSQGLAVGVNLAAANLAPGTYTGSVAVESDFGQKDKVSVTLTVLSQPALSTDPIWLTFLAKKNQTVSPQALTVAIKNISEWPWSVTSDSTWLGISPASGIATKTASVSTTTTGLAAGTYTGYLTFTAIDAVGNNSKIPVYLTVIPSSKIIVTTDLAAATFKITGGSASYTGSGQNWSVEDVLPGTYVAEFAAATGYYKPQSQTLTLGDSGELNFSASYKKDAVSPSLTLSALADGSYTNNQTLNVAGVATDDLALQGVLINDTAVSVNADGTFSQAIQLVAGPNTVTTTATDAAGNKSTDTRTITLDQTAPVITLAGPADNSVTNLVDATVAGTVDKAATVSVKVNDEAAVTATMTGNAFSQSQRLTYYGQNTIQVTATDLAGNVGTAKRTVTFDNVNPTLTLTNPAQDISTNQHSITLQGSVADLTGTTVIVTVDGTVYTPLVTNGTFEQQLALTIEKTYAVIITATDAVGNTTTVQRNIIYYKTPSVLTYTGTTFIAQGGSAVLSGAFKTDGTAGSNLSGKTIAFTIGAGSGTQTCTGTTDAKGNASCTINPVTLTVGLTTAAATFGGDGEIQQSTDSKSVTVFAFPTAGAFVIGDLNATEGNTVTFWGGQWSKANSLSNGSAKDSFKGFADSASSVPPASGGTWSAGEGKSSPPPAGIPSYMAVIVSSNIKKSGSAISGDILKIVIVNVTAYGPDVNGTGTVVGALSAGGLGL